MKKNQIVILFVVIIIFGAVIYSLLTERLSEEQDKPSDLSNDLLVKETNRGLTGWILEIDKENDSLIVQTERTGKTFKAFVSEKTKLLKTELPDNFPTGKEKIRIEQDMIITNIELADFQEGGYISLAISEGSLVGKKEASNIQAIYFYPFVGLPEPFVNSRPEEECVFTEIDSNAWHSRGSCYAEISYSPSKDNIGAPLILYFYQIRNKINGEYYGPDLWHSVDCYEEYKATIQKIINIGPNGDCYIPGKEACEIRSIAIDQALRIGTGGRTLNINPW